MTKPVTIERVQTLRRLTRAVADQLRESLSADLATLAVLFRPRHVLGQYVHGAEKDAIKGADRAFRDLQALYDSVARAQPYTLSRGELKSPVELASVTPEIHPVEYAYQVQSAGETRTVTVRSPLTWVLSYAGYGPTALGDLLSRRTGANEDLHQWLVHQLVLHTVVSNQPGLVSLLGRLHFRLAFVNVPELGLLPQARISSPLSTMRPPDDVIMQSVQLSGMDAFEEVINVDDIARMDNVLKERLLALAVSHGEAPKAE